MMSSMTAKLLMMKKISSSWKIKKLKLAMASLLYVLFVHALKIRLALLGDPSQLFKVEEVLSFFCSKDAKLRCVVCT